MCCLVWAPIPICIWMAHCETAFVFRLQRFIYIFWGYFGQKHCTAFNARSVSTFRGLFWEFSCRVVLTVFSRANRPPVYRSLGNFESIWVRARGHLATSLRNWISEASARERSFSPQNTCDSLRHALWNNYARKTGFCMVLFGVSQTSLWTEEQYLLPPRLGRAERTKTERAGEEFFVYNARESRSAAAHARASASVNSQLQSAALTGLSQQRQVHRSSSAVSRNWNARRAIEKVQMPCT